MKRAGTKASKANAKVESETQSTSVAEPRVVESHVVKQRIVAELRAGVPPFGLHAPIAGGLHNALSKAHELGCTSVQIFSRNPRGWSARPLETEEVEKFRALRAKLKIDPVAVHCNYLVNLAAADDTVREKSILSFREEVERALRIGADYLIVHPGSSKGGCEADGVRTCAESLLASCRDIELTGLMILIENTAGQGECIGYRFEQLAEIKELCRELNLGVCLDTAHAFAAGYDLSAQTDVERMLDELDAAVSLDAVRVVHFNDSKTACGSRVDRHENIGAGLIGTEGLRLVASNARLKHCAFLLETPEDDKDDNRKNLAALRGFIGA